MTTSVNRPVSSDSKAGLFKAIFALIGIILAISWILNSYTSGKVIPVNEPMPTTQVSDPAFAISFDLPAKLTERRYSEIKTYPGRGALYAPTIIEQGEPKNITFGVTRAGELFKLVGGGSEYLCKAMPREFVDLADCTKE